MLAADSVSFGYGSTPVLHEVTVDIDQGAIVGFLGANGSGKTTLLKVLAGSLTPAHGTVTLEGRPLAAVPGRTLARRIAVVPQETQPAFDYTALEIALMGRYPWLGPFEIEGPEDVAAAVAALDATGTGSLADRAFTTLSGGEKQRVVIASALAQIDHRNNEVGRASILVLDEPTTSLDLRYQLEVAALIGRLHDTLGVTILLSTHDLRLAATACSHVVMLASGRVLAAGATRDVLTADRVAELYGVDRGLAAAVMP